MKKSRVYWELERDGKTTSYSLQIAGSCVIFLNQPSIEFLNQPSIFLNQPYIHEYSPIPAPHVLYPENVDKIHDYSVGLLVSYSCGQVFFTLCLSSRVMCAISLGPLLSVIDRWQQTEGQLRNNWNKSNQGQTLTAPGNFSSWASLTGPRKAKGSGHKIRTPRPTNHRVSSLKETPNPAKVFLDTH